MKNNLVDYLNQKQKKYDVMYMDIAITISKMSHCKRAQVGSILVKDDNIISFGFNGKPSSGLNFDNLESKFDNINDIPNFDNNCEDCNGKTLPEVIHAELNMLMKLAKNGTGTSNQGTVYLTLSPCKHCALLLIQSGIKRLVYLEKYHNEEKCGLSLCEKAKIKIEQIIF